MIACPFFAENSADGPDLRGAQRRNRCAMIPFDEEIREFTQARPLIELAGSCNPLDCSSSGVGVLKSQEPIGELLAERLVLYARLDHPSGLPALKVDPDRPRHVVGGDGERSHPGPRSRVRASPP